jgi:hypothetical protein
MTQPGDLDAIRLDNGMYVWTWTSPGGATHQGAKQFRRRGDALNAGAEWLEAQRPLIGPPE